MTQNRIVLLGSSGYVGRHLKTALITRTLATPTHRDCDLTKPQSLENYLRKNDIVINLATAQSGSPHLQEVNLFGTKNLAKATERGKVAYLIHFSTSHHMYKIEPNEYRKSKIDAEEIIRDSQLPHIILCPCNIYGGDDQRGIIPRMIQAVIERRTLQLSATERDFVHLDDVIAAILASLEKQATGTFDLATGTTYTFTNIWEYLQNQQSDLQGKQYEVSNLIDPKILLPQGLKLAKSYLESP